MTNAKPLSPEDIGRAHLRNEHPHSIVYRKERLPDYGPWPELTDGQRADDTLRNLWRERIAEEVARRRKLFGRVHREDRDAPSCGGHLHRPTLCLRDLISTRGGTYVAWNYHEPAVWCTTVEADVTCAECIDVTRFLRNRELAARGLPALKKRGAV
jgi:hypothetical protein